MADLCHPQRLEGVNQLYVNKNGLKKDLKRQGLVVLQKPEKVTVQDCSLNQILQPIVAALLKVVSLSEMLASGLKLLNWQMHSFKTHQIGGGKPFACIWDG